LTARITEQNPREASISRCRTAGPYASLSDLMLALWGGIETLYKRNPSFAGPEAGGRICLAPGGQGLDARRLGTAGERAICCVRKAMTFARRYG
jgi:hypothetical protein